MNKHTAGLNGQQAAEDYLIKKGLTILHRNYRVRTGEIDLIARDGAYFIFIEVKARHSNKYGLPREAVTPAKQNKIIRTAQHYLMRYQLADVDVRFDVVEVIWTEGAVHIEHLENAFWG